MAREPVSGDEPDVKSTDRMRLNPDPLGTVAGEDERFFSSLLAWNRTATRADRLRVWLATGGTKEEFDADHPEAPDATVLLQRAYTTLQALKRGGCDWDLWHDAEAEWTVEALGEFLWPNQPGPVEQVAGKAKPDDVLVRLACRCEGAVLVAAYEADDWQCPVCREEGVPTARTTLREHVIDGGIPTAALTVTRLHMDAPGDWDWL